VRGDIRTPVLEQAGPSAVHQSSDVAEQPRLFAADIAKRSTAPRR